MVVGYHHFRKPPWKQQQPAFATLEICEENRQQTAGVQILPSAYRKRRKVEDLKAWIMKHTWKSYLDVPGSW